MGATEAQQAFASVPLATVDDLVDAGAIIFGTPTRFGNMAGQMRQFLDATGGLWAQGKLVGKVGSVFCSSATQHGGQESTILSFHMTLLHHGMVIVGLPLHFPGPDAHRRDHGRVAVWSLDDRRRPGERMASENELAAARFQGRHVAEIREEALGVNGRSCNTPRIGSRAFVAQPAVPAIRP